MESALRARTAYGNPKAAARTPRQVEYQAFAKITQDLKGASDQSEAAFPALVAALHENLRLWTIVAAGVAEDQNGLPMSLRAQLFNLAQFTRTHTSKVLKGEAEPEALIDINTAIMKGLRQQQEAAACLV